MDFLYADSLGITIDLMALSTDSQPFTIHLYQHQESFGASATKIGNTNNPASVFRTFFAQAQASNADLVLTPEYSCPWNNIAEIVGDPQLWPASRKLWVLGCESITRHELTAFKEICATPGIFCHSEADDPTKNGTFYDPLVYLFRGQHKGTEKLIVLIQFKTAHMGAWFSALERDNLLEGNIIWILRNPGDSHRFMSIICSEAMNLSRELTQQKMAAIDWHTHAFYIYHPQANPDATHYDFRSFRKFVLEAPLKEIIALNWNAYSKYGSGNFMRHATPRSGIYTQSRELDLRESRIRDNHQNGLYYYSFGISNHAFLLNSLTAIFLIQQTRMLIIGAASPQSRRDGPLMQAVYQYDPRTGTFINCHNAVSDAHMNFLTSLSCGCNFLMNTTACILEKERLVCLTCGQIKVGTSLTDLKSLLTFNMKQDTEPNLRVTISDDRRPESEGKKAAYIHSINTLIHHVLPKKEIYPESIRDLKTVDITIGYNSQSRQFNYKFNVIDNHGTQCHATLVYMDGATDGEIKRTFNELQALFDPENAYKRRVVIFYQRGAHYKHWSDPNAGIITHTGDKDGANILNT